MKFRRAFTILELMIVVAVIAVLVTIVASVMSGSLKEARTHKADAMRMALEQAIEAYYAQEGKWPDLVETAAQQMKSDTYSFRAEECDKIFQQIVDKCYGSKGTKSQLVDVSALYVCNAGRVGNNGDGCFDNHSRKDSEDYCGGGRCGLGIDFPEAVAKDSSHKIPRSSMAFGYQGVNEGRFCRLWITYNGRTDKISVSKSKPASFH